MKASEYGVVSFPRIDAEAELLRLRDRFDTEPHQTQPHIPFVTSFSPANLDELLSATEYISNSRRGLKPLACTFRNCVERGESVVFRCLEGGAELTTLHQSLVGSEPTSFLQEAGAFEPRLVVGRIVDPAVRARVMLEANRIGRVLALVDALTLVRRIPDSTWRPVGRFPFGLGRVDYYEKILS